MQFDAELCARFETLLVWRRDVRCFRPDPVPADLLEHLLDLVQLALSVGNSQPWRFVQVQSTRARASVRASFERCNREALSGFTGWTDGEFDLLFVIVLSLQDRSVGEMCAPLTQGSRRKHAALFTSGGGISERNF